MNKLKTILVGESSVGKTAMITQFVQESFIENYLPTYATEKSIKEVTFQSEGKEISKTLEIWDTVGQEKMRAVNKIFMKEAKIVILVYDITKQKSFDELKNYWYDQVIGINNKEKISIAVVGNKSDLYEEQEVSSDIGKEYAKEINALFFESSAKDNESICLVFNSLTKDYYEKFLKPSPNDNNKPNPQPKPQPQPENIDLKKPNPKPQGFFSKLASYCSIF